MKQILSLAMLLAAVVSVVSAAGQATGGTRKTSIFKP